MSTLRAPRIQRLVALLLVWCFAFGAFEAPITDVHDGGATHAEVDRVTGAAHAEHHPDHAAHEAAQGTAHHADTVRHQAPEDAAPGASDHPIHVCHCTHAHAGVLAMARVELPTAEHDVPPVVALTMTPPSVTLDPPTHPPIV